MASPTQSLLQTGTKLWLDSIDPDLVRRDKELGATGATSNPIIVADLIQSGRFDAKLTELMARTQDDEELTWLMTDYLVREAQQVFQPIWQRTEGDDGYVSFEVDPLLEDPEQGPAHAERVQQYIDLGKKWAEGHTNRLIKVPGTPAGLEALEELAAAGVRLNVTLLFTQRQYEAARDAVWRGAQRSANPDALKSVYSIFISRVDVYTAKQVPELSEEAQGLVGLVNAKRLWHSNEAFWAEKGLKLRQEIVFASTGAKLPGDEPDKYVEALAGSDIQTNPPETNDAVEQSGKTYRSQIEQMPSEAVLAEIDEKVDMEAMERVLLEEGVQKFADPQKALLRTVREKREALATTG